MAITHTLAVTIKCQ